LPDKESYTLGYGEGAMQWMTSRTAEVHGAFLLPYLQPGLRLLDCGCGPGTLTLGFARRVAPADCIGIDQEGSQFKAVRETARLESVDNLLFKTGDIYELPFDDADFDIVFASAVLGSVAAPDKVVAEMVRVLKPGGVLALKEFDHAGDIIYPQNAVLGKSIELYHKLRGHNGHEPVAGRRLREFMHAGGCEVKYLRAFYDYRSGNEQLRPYIDRNNYLVNEMLGPQYISLGWCTETELEEQADAWIEFAANPAAVYCSTWFEAVAVKPPQPSMRSTAEISTHN
jgi:ubiquinone/menaquinone biosynthesis C-methylase UbiE